MLRLLVRLPAVALILQCGVAAASTEFYVAPRGDDAAPGTKAKPFATPGRARDAVRRVVKAVLTQDVTVFLRGGIYFLSEPLVFGPADSGTKDRSITYAAFPDETPVLSGGCRIAGWKEDEGGIWRARILPKERDGWTFRQLFVNGRRAIRAREPDATGDRFPVCQVNKATITPKVHRLTFNYGGLKAWRNVGDVELVAPINWKCTRQRIESVDPKTRTVVLAPPYIIDHPLRRFKARTYGWFENAAEFVDQPGEWYLDRAAGVVTYWPRPGDAKTEVIASRLERRLIDVRGTKDAPVRNLHFRGLTFAHVDWPLPPHGHHGAQATIYLRADYDYDKRPRPKNMQADLPQIEGAVRFEYAEGCSVRDGRLTGLGGGGIALRRGCRGCVVEGNEIDTIGANGVMIGENWAFGIQPITLADVPNGNIVRNNHVHHCGIDYLGGIGIWNSYSTHATRIEHNHVHDMPYIGISVGSFSWAHPKVAHSRDHVIAFNHIHDVMEWLADGAGIFTQGRQPGTVLRGNLIHDVKRSRWLWGGPNNGIFMDEHSDGIVAERNTIYDTAGRPIRFHRAKVNTIRDNTLVTPRGGTPYTYNRCSPKTMKYEGNRVLPRPEFRPPDARAVKAGLVERP
jgi:hypothetical protein